MESCNKLQLIQTGKQRSRIGIRDISTKYLVIVVKSARESDNVAALQADTVGAQLACNCYNRCDQTARSESPISIERFNLSGQWAESGRSPFYTG